MSLPRTASCPRAGGRLGPWRAHCCCACSTGYARRGRGSALARARSPRTLACTGSATAGLALGGRSPHRSTAARWGHKWGVVAVRVKRPLPTRVRALPVLAALYRPPEWDRVHGTRTPPVPRARRQLARSLREVPERHFSVAGATGDGTSETARYCHQHRLNASSSVITV
jgi:hypothetical protein